MARSKGQETLLVDKMRKLIADLQLKVSRLERDVGILRPLGSLRPTASPHKRTGLISGGILSINSGDAATFDLSASTSMVVDNYTTPETPDPTPLTNAAVAGVTVTNLATQPRTYISLDSSGSIVQQADTWTTEELRDLVAIGLLVHPNGTTIQAVGGFPVTNYDFDLQVADFILAVGPMNVDGNVISANGANLSLDRSAGHQYRLGANHDTDRQTPSTVTSSGGTALTFRYRYRDGSGDYTEGANTTVIDPTNYDSGTGTPATVSGSDKFQVIRLWAFSTGNVRAMYGQNLYKTMADAEASIFGAVFDADPNLTSNGALRAWLIIKSTETSLQGSNAKFIEADRFGSSGAGGITSSTTTMQQAYNNADEPEITLNASQGALTLQDASSPIGAPLLEVQANGGGTTFLSISATGATLASGTEINEFSIDGTLVGNSDDAVPTEKAVKTYVDSSGVTDHGALTGLADDDHPQYMQDLIDDSSPTLRGNLDTDGNTVLWSLGTTAGASSGLSLDGDGNSYVISGDTEIETIDTLGIGTVIVLTFTGSPNIVHSSDIVCPNNLDLQISDGDTLIIKEYATGDWIVLNHQRAGSKTGLRDAWYTCSGSSLAFGNASSAQSTPVLFTSTGSSTSVDTSLFSIASNAITVVEPVRIKIFIKIHVSETVTGRCKPKFLLFEDPNTGTFAPNTLVQDQGYIRDTNLNVWTGSAEYIFTPAGPNYKYKVFMSMPYADSGSVRCVALVRSTISFQEMP